MRRSHLFAVASLGLWASSILPDHARAEEPKGERKYFLERVDDAAVVQIYADGFKDLPLKEKLLAWHLSQAAIAGRDIYYRQRYADSIAMRDLLEAVVTHPEGVDAMTLGEIRVYTKLFWINSGPYHHLTARKFILKCSPEAFASAVKTAVKNGATLPRLKGETLDAALARLQPAFFDPAYKPIVTNKTPDRGEDMLASSASSLYVGVTMADLKGFVERYGLNSQLVKKDGKLVENVYKVGGLYGEEISRVISHLERARDVAPEPTARALDALIKFYRTGEEEDRRQYDIAWVKDKDATVDTINGFIEVYLDPRGVKGAWEAAVHHVNAKKTGTIKAIGAQAQWFEDHMPWVAAYRKPNVKGITANAVDIVIETGETGPTSPIGINLPNDESIRESHGSKSVTLANIIEAADKATPTTLRGEFSWTKEEAERATTWSTLSGEMLVNMHEVIGHASGRVSDSLKGKPQEMLKQYFSALEEGRADLVGLYYMADPKLAELGVVSTKDQPEFAQSAFEGYTRNALVQLRRIRKGTQIEEDHMRNRQMVIHWLIQNTRAVEIRKRDGKTYYVMIDAKAFREGVGKLLAEVQRIKSEGDFPAAKALFETYGIHFDPTLRDEVIARVAKLDLPTFNAFIMPKLELVKGTDGVVKDVAISYPLDLTTQMLEYSAIQGTQ
jgi:dipeptidyl-peptidase-3